MKTRAYVSRTVIHDEDPAYNIDHYYINANESEIGELSFDQLKSLHQLIGEQIRERFEEDFAAGKS